MFSQAELAETCFDHAEEEEEEEEEENDEEEEVDRWASPPLLLYICFTILPEGSLQKIEGIGISGWGHTERKNRISGLRVKEG